MTYCYGFASVVVHRSSWVFFSRTNGPIFPNLVCSICRTRRQEIVNSMTPTPREGNLVVKNVKLMYFLKNLLLYSGTWFRQTKCIAMMTMEGSTKIINFMTTRARVLLLERCHISHIMKMHFLFKIFFFIPDIDQTP